jgi:hypothetical protein
VYLFIISLVHSIWCLKNNTRLILFFSFQVSSVDIWPIKRTYSRTPNWGEYEIYFAFVKWRIKLFYLIDMTHEHQTRCLWTVQYVRHVNLNFIKKKSFYRIFYKVRVLKRIFSFALCCDNTTSLPFRSLFPIKDKSITINDAHC